MFITYARNIFIPVTNVCRNECGYCGFKRDVKDAKAYLMRIEEIVPILENGKKANCTEVLFTFGEYADDFPEYKEWLKDIGYSRTIDYIVELCNISIDMGLLPHTNAGVMDFQDLKLLKPVNASMGLMLETTAQLKAHDNCEGKEPHLRLKTMENAGKLKIPFTTGLLIGIGETIEDRIHSLEKIAELHKKYGHIQEIIIQNFTPKKDTLMENHPIPDMEEIIQTVKISKEILPSDIAIQVPPNLIDPNILIGCGVTDIGGISPVTIDWINPEHKWPSISKLEKTINAPIRERLPIYPQYIKKKWYDKRLESLINSLIDDDGYRKEVLS